MQLVEIRVKGQIDERWSEWLEGLTITYTSESETVLAGSVIDQAALYGLIARLRDLGLPLLSVNTGKASAGASQQQVMPDQGDRQLKGEATGRTDAWNREERQK